MDGRLYLDVAVGRDGVIHARLALLVRVNVGGRKLSILHFIIRILVAVLRLLDDLLPAALEEGYTDASLHGPALSVVGLDGNLRCVALIVDVAVGVCVGDRVASHPREARARVHRAARGVRDFGFEAVAVVPGVFRVGLRDGDLDVELALLV